MSIMLPDNTVITDQYCDRHPLARARIRASKCQLELFLCSHCGATQVEALASQGFHLIAVAHVADA